MDKKVYVLSDIHGHGQAFFDLLDQIGFTRDDFLYIIGDVIDRGPDGIKLLDYIRQQDNMKLYMGNHEDMMLKGLADEDGEWMLTWMMNGGGTTLNAYEHLMPEEKEKIYTYVANLPLAERITFQDKSYILVHAGLYLDDQRPMDVHLASLDWNEALWVRQEFLCSSVVPEDEIIYGHTPTGIMPRFVPDLSTENQRRCEEFHMVSWKNRTGIDCGAAARMNLGCLRLNDRKEFYVEVLT